jgi:hypothetical protein
MKKKVWRGRIENLKKDGGFSFLDAILVHVLNKNGDI